MKVRCKYLIKHAKYTIHTQVTLYRTLRSATLTQCKTLCGRYLRNADSMGWVLSWLGYMSQRLPNEQKTFIAYIGVTVPTPNVLSGRYICAWYFSPTFRAIKQIPAPNLAAPFCCSSPTLHQPTSFKIPEPDSSWWLAMRSRNALFPCSSLSPRWRQNVSRKVHKIYQTIRYQTQDDSI